MDEVLPGLCPVHVKIHPEHRRSGDAIAVQTALSRLRTALEYQLGRLGPERPVIFHLALSVETLAEGAPQLEPKPRQPLARKVATEDLYEPPEQVRIATDSTTPEL